MSFADMYDYIISRCPQLATRSTRILQEWVMAGYDFEKDVKPAVDECTKYGGMTIKSFAFFHEKVRQTNEGRLNAPKEKPKESDDLLRARNIAWHRKRGLTTTRVGHQDFEWLERYEQKNGRVDA